MSVHKKNRSMDSEKFWLNEKSNVERKNLSKQPNSVPLTRNLRHMSKWPQEPTEVKRLFTIRPGAAKVKRPSSDERATLFEKIIQEPHLGQTTIQYKPKAAEVNNLSSDEKATSYEAMAMKGKTYCHSINRWQYERIHLQWERR